MNTAGDRDIEITGRQMLVYDMPRAMTLEERIERFAESLPEGWRVVIAVERGSGTVTAVRPDGTEVDMGDGESSIGQQFADAGRLAMDETDADKMSAAECSSNNKARGLPAEPPFSEGGQR